MPGTVARSTFCITRGVLMGPWAWGEVMRSKAISGTPGFIQLFPRVIHLCSKPCHS